LTRGDGRGWEERREEERGEKFHEAAEKTRER